MPRASASVLLALAGLGAICTAAGLVGYFLLIAEVGAARATVVTYVNPAVAVALGTLILGEPFTAAIGGAFVLILAGSVLATRSAARDTAPALARSGGRASLCSSCPQDADDAGFYGKRMPRPLAPSKRIILPAPPSSNPMREQNDPLRVWCR